MIINAENLTLPRKELFLEDKAKTLSYPGAWHDDDIKFHADINEYGKSPIQSFMEIMANAEPIISDEEWMQMGENVKEVGRAVPEFIAGSAKSAVEDVKAVGRMVKGDFSVPQEYIKTKQDTAMAGMKILGFVVEQTIGRVREPIRQFVGDAIQRESFDKTSSNVLKAFVMPASVERITSPAKLPFTEAERSGGTLALLPRAVANAIEDVFVYGANFKTIPSMLENYQINAARNLVQKDIRYFVDIVKAKTPYTEAEAMSFLSRPDVLKDIWGRVNAGKVKMYAGVPALPEDIGAGTKALGSEAAAAAKSPAVAAKLVEEIGKTRSFVTSIQEELPQLKVSGQYVPRSTDILAQQARTQIQDNIAVAEKMAMTGTDDASIATGAELLKYYCDEAAKATSPAIADALYEKAANLGNDMAVRLTELGRSVQAASILSRMTPEGQIRFAAKSIQKYNAQIEKDSGLFGLRKKIPELTPQQSQVIVDKLNEILGMAEGEAKAIKWKALQDYISDMVPSPLLKKITTIWKAGLLTGIKTTGVNMFSNFSHAFGTEVLKDIPAAAVDRVVALFTGERSMAFTLRGLGSAKEGFRKGVRFLKTGYDERNVLGKLDYHRVNFGSSPIAKGLQTYEELIFRLLGAEDQIFYYGAKARSIADQAIAQAKNQGLKGPEAKAFIDNLIANPTDDMVTLAVADAETSVFQNETFLSKAGSAIQRIPGAEFVLPFAKTPSAVAMQILNYSPVGAIKTILRNIGKGKFDQRDFSKGMGRSLLGVPVLWLGYELFSQDRLSLDKPTSEGERKLWELEGRKPNAIKVGDKWRSIQVLGPVGNLILIGGQFARAYTKSGSISEAATKASWGGVKSLSEQTFLTGISAATDAAKDPERYAESFGSRLVSSVVPTIIVDMARATDTKERRAENIAQRVASRIPVVRRSLEPQINIAGQERMIKENFFETMMDPTRPTTAISDPVAREIRRLIDAGYRISTTQVGDKEGYKILTQEQNTELWQRSGQVAFDKISAYMQTGGYQSTDDEIRAKDIDRIIDQAKVVARTEKVLEITAGLDGMELKAKLSEAKKDGLLNKEILELYKRMR